MSEDDAKGWHLLTTRTAKTVSHQVQADIIPHAQLEEETLNGERWPSNQRLPIQEQVVLEEGAKLNPLVYWI